MTMREDLRQAGFSADEISDYLAAERARLSAAGFGPDEIAAELGGVADDGPIRQVVGQARAVAAGRAAFRHGKVAAGDDAGVDADGLKSFIAAAGRGHGVDDAGAGEIETTLSGLIEAGEIGLQSSSAGLVLRGALPDDAGRQFSRWERLAFQAGVMAGDLPAMAAGFVLGGGGAAAAGQMGPQAALPEEIVTVPAAAMGGAFFVPAAIRKGYMDALSKGEVVDFADFWDRTVDLAVESGKAWLTGAMTGRAGQAVSPAMRPAVHLATMVTVGAAVEGQVPTREEFEDAAILILGFGAASHGAAKLQRIYAETGRRPTEVLRDMENDPAIAAELRAEGAALPRVYEAEAARQQAAEAAKVKDAAEGLRRALDDPAAFDALKKARPEIRDHGQVQEMLERLTPERAEAERARIGLDPEITEPRLKPDVNRQVTAAAEELLVSGDVVRDPTRLLSDQIQELLLTDRIEPGRYAEVLARHGVTAEGFADLWRADTRKAAQHLQQLSAVQAKVNRMLDQASPHDMEILRQAGLDLDAQAKSMWRRVDDVRRGILVTQLTTAVRNFEVQVGRVGIDVLQRGLDAGMQRLLPEARRAPHPADAFEVVMRLFSPRETKKLAEDVLSRFPKEADDLFMRYSSDLTAAGKGTDLMAKAEKAVWTLNIMNRFQEYAIRRPVFVAALAENLAKQGKDLEKIIAGNRIGEIARDDVKAAIETALEFTFAKNFDPHAKGSAERLAGRFISLVNAMPGVATLPFPFPRFLMNAIKFQYEFSPLGVLRLLSKDERAKIAAGDTSAISRAAIGTGMLFAAWQIRNSDWAGEKWWELRLPDGETVSLLPFNPFVFHLFMADVVKRAQDGSLPSLTTKDLMFGFLSSNFRAGAGLYLLDSFIDGILGLGDEEKALRKLQEFGGEVGSGFLIPVQMLKDAYAEYDKWLGSGQEAVIRDRRAEPFLGPFKDKIPGLSQTLPALESPTRAAPLRRPQPGLRQLTGIGIADPKSPAERELDRLGFSRQEIAPTVGDPQADQLIAKHLGPLVDRAIAPLVQTPFYQAQSNEVKGGVLREAMLGLRQVAMAQAKAENPLLFTRISLQRIPRRRRLMLESLLGRDIDDLLRPPPPGRQAKGAPVLFDGSEGSPP